MAVRTFRLTAGADGNFAAMAEADQSVAVRSDGWTVARIAAANFCNFDIGVKAASGSFNTTAVPSALVLGSTANAAKTPTALSGTFAATSWTFTFGLRAVTGSSQKGRVNMRVYKSVNADGSSSTELTTARLVGTTSVSVIAASDVTSVVTWSPGTTIVLNNEYLFFALAWEITTASGNNSSDVFFSTGVAGSTGTWLVTPNFVSTKPVTGAVTNTQSVSGAVVRRAAVRPAGVTNTQSASGNVVKRTAVVASITNAQSVSGALQMGADAYSTAIVADSPSGYWRFEEASGTAVAQIGGVDLGDNGTGGGVPGLLSKEPAFNGRLFVAANNSFVNGGSQPFAYNTFTWEMWIKRTRTDTYEVLVDQYNGGTRFSISDDGTLMIEHSYGDIIASTTSLKILDTDTHHIAVSRVGIGGDVTFYVDKVPEVGTPGGDYSWDVVTNWPNYSMFVGASWGNYAFDGILDELAIYDHVLTGAQIANHNSIGGGIALPASFPSTTLKDNFNRADGALGSNWAIDGAGDGPMAVVSNMASVPASTYGFAYWTPGQFGPDSEVWGTMGKTGNARLYWRIDDVTAWTHSYWAKCNNSAIEIFDKDGHSIAYFPQAIAIGDGVGIRMIGNVITAWWRTGAAGAWVTIGTVTNTSSPGAGYIGMDVDTNSGAFDDFGGGTYVPASSGTVKPVTPAGITNTQSASGAVRRAAAIKPAGVTNTQSAGGAVRRLRPVVPAGITNSQQVSGAIRVQRAIKPTTVVTNTQAVTGAVTKPSVFKPISGAVTNTQNVSGSIRRIAAIKPAGITNTQAVSGSVYKPSTGRPITPGAVTNSQSVSGRVNKLAVVRPTTTVTNTQSVSGAVSTKPVKVITPSGVTNSQSVSGSVRALRVIRPTTTITNTQSVAGAITTLPVKVVLPATTTNTQTVSGSVRRIAGIKPSSITNTQSVTGGITAIRLIKPTVVTNTQSASGTLHVGKGIRPVSQITYTNNVTGDLKNTLVKPSTGITNTQQVSGSLITRRSIKPTTSVTFTNNVSAMVVRRFPIKPTTTIINMNAVSGALYVGRGIRPAGIINLQRVAGSIVATRILISASKLHPGKIVRAHRGKAPMLTHGDTQLTPGDAEIPLLDHGATQLGERDIT